MTAQAQVVFVLLVLLLLGGCGDSPTGPVDPEELSFAPALGVDLTQMTRTETGLYIQDEVVGSGAEAVAGATVTVHYTGWFHHGAPLDSSRDPGRTAITFGPLGSAAVIAGLNQGVQGMREGGHRLLVIPYQLAHGSIGSPGVAPYATLVFRIEMLSVASPVDPEELSFAPALGVDLTQMTRTGTGLYIQDEVVGNGAEAGAGATVTVHYTGWFHYGAEFDSSRDPGRTAFTFGPLGSAAVIAGWNQGVQGMREGGHRLLVIPYQLAYGSDGRPGVPPYATLVFRIEMLSAGAN